MDVQTSIALSRQVLMIALMVAAPILGIGLIVGVGFALLQALTSLQEQTLTMVPKILAIGAAIFFLTPWILTRLIDFTRAMFLHLSDLGAGT